MIDEALSSQSGKTNRRMKEVLTVGSLENAESEEGGETPDSEDAVDAAVEAKMKRHARRPNVSFFAFKAAPKQKTLELFGARQADGSTAPFSLYSSMCAVSVRGGGGDEPALYAGLKDQYNGPDVVNMRIPGELRGRSAADLHLAVEGKVENMVNVSVQ